ncbi:MAG: hypothetical protein KF757_05070 [Phycisphaeraceae bacterium]|nr:hypothetical protein [Phycisphaeraceae bacterium]MCW5763861.1 hypothetical protein [Phycisphaeraceae bacterium]
MKVKLFMSSVAICAMMPANSSQGVVARGLQQEPCNIADFAEPYGVLDFFDAAAFLQAFANMDESADLVHDGAFNSFDLLAFMRAFSKGCD